MEYQQFVDSGGYSKREYWPEKFSKDGHDLSWSDEMAEATRPNGPSRTFHLDGEATIPKAKRTILSLA